MEDISSWTDEEVVNAVNKYLEENWSAGQRYYWSANNMREYNGEFGERYILLMIRCNSSTSADVDSGSSVSINIATGEAKINHGNTPPNEWFNINDYYVG